MAALSREGPGGSRGPTLADCQRLWDTLTTEYVTDLALRFEFQAAKQPSFIARLVCWSPGLDPETGGPRDHVWASKELHYGYEAITFVQLYDLLIQSYRAIQNKLGGQVELPLS